MIKDYTQKTGSIDEICGYDYYQILKPKISEVQAKQAFQAFCNKDKAHDVKGANIGSCQLVYIPLHTTYYRSGDFDVQKLVTYTEKSSVKTGVSGWVDSGGNVHVNNEYSEVETQKQRWDHVKHVYETYYGVAHSNIIEGDNELYIRLLTKDADPYETKEPVAYRDASDYFTKEEAKEKNLVFYTGPSKLYESDRKKIQNKLWGFCKSSIIKQAIGETSISSHRIVNDNQAYYWYLTSEYTPYYVIKGRTNDGHSYLCYINAVNSRCILEAPIIKKKRNRSIFFQCLFAILLLGIPFFFRDDTAQSRLEIYYRHGILYSKKIRYDKFGEVVGLIIFIAGLFLLFGKIVSCMFCG